MPAAHGRPVPPTLRVRRLASTATGDPLPVLRAAVRHDADAPSSGARAPSSRPAAVGCAARAGRRPTLLDSPEPADDAAGARPTGEAAAPATWDEALDRAAAGIRARAGDARRRTPSAVFGGGGLTNEKAYLLGKFARVALRHLADRLQRPLLHELGRGRGQARVRARPRAAVPARATSAGADCVLLVGSNLAETMPPVMQYLDPAARGRRHADRRRPAPHADRAPPPTCTCSRSPAPTSRSPTACCTSRSSEGLRRRGVRRGAHDRLGRRARGRRGVLAGPGRAGHRRARARPARGRAAAGRGRPTAMVLTARGAEQHAHGVDTVLGVHQPRAGARPAGPAGLRLGLPHRPGQRPGRARARPEGRPAARLPQARDPDRRRAGRSSPWS